MDIGKQTTKINCPDCKRVITISLNQVASQATVTCSCGHKVRLVDNRGSAKKSVRDINKAFKDLENTFKKFGR